MIKSKKQMFIIVGAFALVMLLGTVTYAFFNYTRTGSSNVIRVGRINFVTRQTNTINLTNLFPIDPTDSTAMNDSTKVGTLEIEIEGDTDYGEGIEYLVSSVNSNIYTSSGVQVPISLDVTVTDLGTPNANYFTARESKNATIYKKIVGDTLVGDQMLLVGYIKPNTTSGTAEGIDGSITIKAYLDKNKILISDTYDGTESDNMGTPNSMAQGKTVLTTTEWNALQSSGLSFKVKVEANEGIWVNGSLEEIMRKSAVMDNTTSTYVTDSAGINFGAMSSDENGKGVYMRAGTQNDAYPIMYYRGDVNDNNVVFANKCWKTVRTTDTGGVKLIYNGEKGNVYEKVPLTQSQYNVQTNTDGTNTDVWTFDTTDNSWNTSYTTGSLELSFKVPAGDNYVFEMTGKNGASGSGGYTIYKGSSSVNGGGGGGDADLALNHPYGTLTVDDVIKFTYSGGGFTTPTTIKVRMIGSGDLITDSGCANSGTATQITLNVGGTDTNTFKFSTDSGATDSPAYNGYMYGDVYTYNSGAATSGAYFGSSFTWDGTNYKLVDAVTTKNNTHHYTCNLTTADGTCTTLRYYYYQNYYVNLTGGDGIEDALRKMQTNTTDSNAKAKIDTWYASNMTSYTNKLEDTIWCNDRSFGDNNNNGWIANGGDLSTYLYYGAYQRSAYAANTSTVKNQPSLVCANKNDRFTVNNGNGNQALTYPTALLTEDEIVLAGGVAGVTNGSFYLTSGAPWWSLSPYAFNGSYAFEFYVISLGALSDGYVRNSIGVRPSVSLKPGTPVVSGTGTVTDPYVIG